jgi:type IV secretion system protein VirB6/type IV secretion system protein TrbL
MQMLGTIPPRLAVIWAALVLFVPFFCGDAHAAIDNAGILDNVLARYSAAAATWASYITSRASWLFWTLTAISLVWTFGIMALSKADIGEFFAEFVRFTVFTGFFWWLLTNGPTFATAIMDSLRTIAGTASGLGPSLSPSGIVDIGFDIFSKVLEKSTVWSPIDSATGLIMSGVILIVLAMIGISMLLLLISGWILAFAGIFFLGFGGSRWTSELAINYYKTVLSVAAQLLTMVLLVGIGKSFVDQYYTAMDAGLNLKELAVMLVVSVVLLTLVTKVPPLIGNLAMGGGSGSLGSGLGLGTAIGTAALGSFALSRGAGLFVGGAASVAGGAQAIAAAGSLASENVAAGTDIVSRMTGAIGGNDGGGSSGSGGAGTPLASAMDGAAGSSSSSSSSGSTHGNGTDNGSPRRGGGVVAAGKIAVDAAAILGKTAGKMAIDKMASVVQGRVQAAQERIDATLGGRMAANIRAQGAPAIAASQFGDDSLARAERTPLNAESAVDSTSATVAAASASVEETHTPIFEQPIPSRADERSVDLESEVAAFRDRDKKST